MCSAALSLWEQLPSVVRRWRRLAATLALTITGACSVYSDDLLSAAGDVTSGGGDVASHAGKSSSSGAGGKLAIDQPGNGGDGGDDPTHPAGGSTSEAGTAGSASSLGGHVGSGTAGGGGAGGAGGAGGTAAAGGAAGSAGTAGAVGAAGAGSENLLDGFEDQDLTLEQSNGRGGVWYLFNDTTVGTAGPAPLVCSPLTNAPAELGLFAMHITATGFTGFGSGLGVDFRAGRKAYDGSMYSGIRFWAKVGAGKNTKHRLQIADASTDAAGGKCNPAANAPTNAKCEDHFGYDATFTTSWAQYVIGFDQLKQFDWGYLAPAITTTTLYGLQVTAKPKAEVDLWLDQLEFF